MRAALCVALALAGSLAVTEARSDGTVGNPISKVVKLLSDLQAQIEKEGAKFAAQYDKLACYCKEQSDGKQYAIEKSEALIQALTSEIDELGAQITQLGTEITDLGTKITGLETDIQTAVDERGTAHSTYLTETQEVDEAINATIDAIAAIKAEKDKMVDAKNVKLMQLEAAALKLLQAKQVPMSGKAHAYEYHSNDILGMLANLTATFKEQKEKLDKDEIDSVGAFNIAKTNMENLKRFAEEEKLAKETLKSEKETTKSAKEGERTQETTDKDADKAFLDELTTQCQTKATEWDDNSKTRADELTAIAKAIELLQTGVKTNYGANKDLAGLAVGKKLSHAPMKDVAKSRPVSFLQLRGSGAAQNAAARQVLQLVDTGASRLKSATLAGLAVKLELRGRGYESTVALINDMISKLEQEAQDEASLKQKCETDMKSAIESRDANKNLIEKHTSSIATKMAEKAASSDRISDLTKDIGMIGKARKEATELRTGESAMNAQTKAEAEAGLQAVTDAIDILDTYYKNAKSAFIQMRQPKDRDGVALAIPETETAGYEGKQALGGGIIGLLEEIKKDFERTIAQIDASEGAAETDYDALMTSTQSDIDTKNGEVSSEEGKIANNDADIVSLKDSVLSTKDLLDGDIKELAALVAKCTSGEDSWAEKKKKREEEIEVLKECVTILEGFTANKGAKYQSLSSR